MLSGLGLPILGVAAYAMQLSLRRLMLPWYLPAAALLGVALVVASLWERRTVWRALALVMVLLLAGFELLALIAMRLPPYAGPIAVGRPFPAFEARRADGTPFTQNDLIGDQHHALVFFRGRW
jgi:cytochrome oxidase Cu insertion factor (SCO1/SenC/PrrC family)